MKFYGKAKDAAANIITAFSEGRVPPKPSRKCF